MTNLSTLKSLQAKIREATGADRRLDADIAEAIAGWKSFPGDNWIGPHGRICVPNYTTDPDGLGACVALMREVLPGWRRVTRSPGASWHPSERIYSVALIDDGDRRSVGEQHVLETHATLLAICAALIAEQEAKEKADV